MSWTIIIDLLLAGGLLALAWQALIGGTLFRGIVMFVVFGMVLALAWAWLGSPDLAMAEAAIGAGVTGALLMIAHWRLRKLGSVEPRDPSPARSRIALLTALLGSALVAAIGLSAVSALDGERDAARLMSERLPETGLGNPITAVLIIFRNLDTLLEVAVVLAAYVAARAALGTRNLDVPRPPFAAPLLGSLVVTVAPLSILVALYLFKAGSQSPGGAFQASAMLAALGVMLLLTRRLGTAPKADFMLRTALIAGTLIFCAVGLGALMIDLPLMGIPGMWAVYLIEAAMMVSIGVTLVLLFAGSAGLGRARS